MHHTEDRKEDISRLAVVSGCRDCTQQEFPSICCAVANSHAWAGTPRSPLNEIWHHRCIRLSKPGPTLEEEDEPRAMEGEASVVDPLNYTPVVQHEQEIFQMKQHDLHGLDTNIE